MQYYNNRTTWIDESVKNIDYTVETLRRNNTTTTTISIINQEEKETIPVQTKTTTNTSIINQNDEEETITQIKLDETIIPNTSANTNINANEDSEVEGVLVTTKTEPPFQIWLFRPEDDIISRKIRTVGVYEPEETSFLKYIFSDSNNNGWAVDIGANIGFHTLHMAALGARVIAFEPSPDTATLFKKSILANGFAERTNSTSDSSTGYVHLIEAAAAATPGTGHLVRYPQSAGMTILQRDEDSSELPFGLDNVVGTNITLLRPSTVISDIIRNDDDTTTTTTIISSPFKLLKVDAEGHELHAFRGVNLTMYEFEYITFELFPELLIQAGGTNPLDLFSYITSNGYYCATDPASITWQPKKENILKDLNQMNDWYQTQIVPKYKKDVYLHLNLYCKKDITK